MDTKNLNGCKITVPYVSVWDGGIEIKTTASADIKTGEISDIVPADVQGLEICESQHIILNGEIVYVYEDEHGYAYWADIENEYIYDDIPACDWDEEISEDAILIHEVNKLIESEGKGKLKKYTIPVVWQMCGRITVRAGSEAEAKKLVFAPETPLPDDKYYIDDSIEIDGEGEITVKNIDEN